MHRRLAPKERYPNLFLIVRDKDAKVVNYLAYKNGCIYWNLLFIREVHGESVTHLFLHCVVDWELGLWFLACLVFPRYCRIPCCSYLVGRDVLAREAMGKFGKLFLHA